MEKTRYYHFLLTKSEEEEQQKLHGDGPWPLKFDVVEIRKNSCDNHPLENLPVFPWQLHVKLPLNQMGDYGPIELSPEQVYDHVLKYWDAEIVSQLIRHGHEKIPIAVQDLDSGLKHEMYLVKWKAGAGEEKYKIPLYWKNKDVEKQGEKDSLLIGMYWNINSSCLCFSVLDGQY